jgi:2-keto-4-pentenoate hydratase/2-oxohepta-3-ene-1,7-dioic acid hydratase in catechol pathway
MKLLRYGPAGFEKPGLLDVKGQIRDLSGVIGQLGAEQLSPAELRNLNGIAVDALPVVSGSPRLGTPYRGIGKFIAVGLNFSDHAAEARMPVPSGVGMGHKPTPVSLKAGDVVRLGIVKLGEQRQTVVPFST